MVYDPKSCPNKKSLSNIDINVANDRLLVIVYGVGDSIPSNPLMLY